MTDLPPNVELRQVVIEEYVSALAALGVVELARQAVELLHHADHAPTPVGARLLRAHALLVSELQLALLTAEGAAQLDRELGEQP